MAERLKELPELKVLQLAQLGKKGTVSERGLKALAGLSVFDLRLVHSPAVNKTLVGELSAMKALRALDLTGGPVTDDELSELAKCLQLTKLVLNETEATDAGLEHVAKMTELLEVQLRKTKVTRDGVEKLAAARPKCRIEWDGGIIEPTKKP